MAQTVASLTAALAEINTAITAALIAQSVGSDGTNVQRASLDTLYKNQKIIQRQLDGLSADASTGQSRMFARTRVTGIGSVFQ